MRIRNYSERTIHTYCALLTDFIGHVNTPPLEITTQQLKDYLYLRLKKDKISISTINQYISAWKITYVHVLGKDWEGFRLIRPRNNRSLPVILSQKEAYDLVNSPKNLKHRAMLYVMYSTGMRRNEVLSLKIGDIDSSRMVITIRNGKGKKDRQLILHPKVLGLLREYFDKYRPKDHLFEGYGKNNQYSASSLTSIVKNSAKKVGITKPVSIHTLRHCYATHMLEKGANIKLIQKLMGHKSITTTSRYLSVANINNNRVPNPIDCDEGK